MEHHIKVEDQLEHLENKKNIVFDNKHDAVDFLNTWPYGLSIQQVKYFFKCSTCGYKQYKFKEWQDKYIKLQSDSFQMLNEIILVESKIKNYIFQKSYKNEHKRNIVVNSIRNQYISNDELPENVYYKIINNASMGELILALEELYKAGYKDTFNINDVMRVFEFDPSCKTDLQKFRTYYSQVQKREYILDKISKEELQIAKIPIIQKFIKREIQYWIKQGVINFENKIYLNKLYTPFLKFLFSNKTYSKLTDKSTEESRLFIDILMNIIDVYNLEKKFRYSQIGEDLEKLTDNVYQVLTDRINITFRNQLKEKDSVAEEEWNKLLSKKNLDVNYVIQELQKSNIPEEYKENTNFNSTVRILRIYKQFRDQIAHGKTITETLKTSNDIMLKNFVLSNTINGNYKLNSGEYIALNNYWDDHEH
ncbi:hypothetical protein R2F61_05495 [Mollicutes bacterium LVI A0078]|nr:hypothetical protein RZE84_05515 [Mollicutes bacterium LVI A0075]WOO90184.1 hypothetical protein R2F61_05495 [Mollicutes bacterium LVI A0078]